MVAQVLFQYITHRSRHHLRRGQGGEALWRQAEMLFRVIVVIGLDADGVVAVILHGVTLDGEGGQIAPGVVVGHLGAPADLEEVTRAGLVFGAQDVAEDLLEVCPAEREAK